MPINSKKKGANGERLWRDVCRSEGYTAVRRTAQYCGNTGDASDCVGLDGIYQEVKFVERLNIHDAMNQAIRDCEAAGKGDIPIVAHKKKYTKFLVTMRAEDFFKMYREYKKEK